jgi:hypothetical protein
VGRLLDKVGPRLLAALGGVFFIVSLVLLAQLGPDASLGDIAWRILIMGAGFSFAMPSLTAAGMGSLPDISRGVGSGVINTGRQFGFVMGVAILVAIFSHTISSNISAAVTEARTYVNNQAGIPAFAREQIIASLENAAAENRGGGAGPGGTINPLAGAPAAAPGSAQEQQQKQLAAELSAIFKGKTANAFRWPYYGGAVAALLSIPFSLMVGRRLGQDRARREPPGTGGSRAATATRRRCRRVARGARQRSDMISLVVIGSRARSTSEPAPAGRARHRRGSTCR